MKNEIRLQFPAQAENERFARSVVSAFAAQLDPTLEELADLRTAVSEAVTNAILHGYRGQEGIVTLIVQLLPARRIRVRVRDHGVGIPNVKQAMEPLWSGDPGGERGGMGFTIMQSFTDALQVRSAPGRGTTVTMTKRLK